MLAVRGHVTMQVGVVSKILLAYMFARSLNFTSFILVLYIILWC